MSQYNYAKNQAIDSDQMCVVFNPSNQRDKRKLEQLEVDLRKDGLITELPFVAAKEEVQEFLNKHKELPANEDELLQYIIRAISKEVPSISTNSLQKLFQPISHDFSMLLSKVREYSNSINEDTRFIYLPYKRTLAKYIGPKLHRALTESRFLGLIPLDAINALRNLRIGSIGASVAGGSLDQLVSLGAEYVTAYDESYLAPSNQPRMSSGSFLDNGQSKAFVVARQLTERNPYGHFNGIHGRVVADEADRKNDTDVTFESFAEKHDIFLEVADAPNIKAGFRKFMADNYPTKPIFFIADVGNNPFSNLEIPSEGNYFGQGMSYERLSQLSTPPTSPSEAIGSVYEMVRDHFPMEHKVQFLLARLGMSGFWSQTPISMRESAAITAKLMIRYLLDTADTNQNITIHNSPTHFFEYSPKDEKTIERIYEQFFPKGR